MTAKNVEASLIGQLRASGADIDAFRALIGDYMALYRISEALKRDIRKRGTIVECTGSTGQRITKPNASIKELRDTNKSMLTILRQLGLSIDTVQASGADDEL
jgi:phage terminase small subunit